MIFFPSVNLNQELHNSVQQNSCLQQPVNMDMFCREKDDTLLGAES